jgi:hypothetical protein
VEGDLCHGKNDSNLLREYQADEWSFAELWRRYEVSRKTGNKWWRYESEGLECSGSDGNGEACVPAIQLLPKAGVSTNSSNESWTKASVPVLNSILVNESSMANIAWPCISAQIAAVRVSVLRTSFLTAA